MRAAPRRSRQRTCWTPSTCSPAPPGRTNSAFPVSPLGHRRSDLSVEPAVRELTQRWFARLGETPDATVEGDALSELRAEIEALVRS